MGGKPRFIKSKAALDYEKTLRVFRQDFRLDTATDLAFPTSAAHR